jgi:hypothetical protein
VRGALEDTVEVRHSLILPDGQITAPKHLRARAILSRQIKLRLPVQSCSQKYFHSLFAQITCISLASRPTQRGGSRSSRTRGGMRWTLMVPITNGTDADGEVVWSWRQVSQKYLRGDGGKKARSPGRARNKLLKPLRGECRATRRDRGDLLACFLLLHARLRAHRAPGIPCSPPGGSTAPSDRGGRDF